MACATSSVEQKRENSQTHHSSGGLVRLILLILRPLIFKKYISRTSEAVLNLPIV